MVSTGRFRLSKFHSRTWLRITYAMVPSATLLVYYTRQDGEIVADAVTFTVDDLFKSKVLMLTTKGSSVFNCRFFRKTLYAVLSMIC